MDEKEKYPLTIGLTFIFNLLLGTGVLAIPYVFGQAGYLIGVIVITVLATMSLLQVTFLVETMANANFITRLQGLSLIVGQLKKDSEVKGDKKEVNKVGEGSKNVGNLNSAFESSTTGLNELYPVVEDVITCTDQPNPPTKIPIKDNFNIEAKFELGDLTGLFLHPLLSKFFFLSIIVYLFGDLIIFNALMAKSLREISCTSINKCDDNATASGELRKSGGSLNLRCWNSVDFLSRSQVYQIYLFAFVAILLPLTYAGLKKTQSIQVVTIVLRWLAFFSMVSISLRKIFFTDRSQSIGHPSMINLRHVPKMFGVCVYAFMCHHSVPSILTPIRNKKHLLFGLTVDYFFVAACYLLISLTGVFAFPILEDVYTLNFTADDCQNSTKNSTTSSTPPFFAFFLPTYPIFTMFSSYTMIALTLINNFKVLARGLLGSSSSTSQNTLSLSSRILLPLAAMIPPLTVALFTEDVGRIVGFVGSYAGGLIQYVFPCLLVFTSRMAVQKHLMQVLVQQEFPVNFDDNLRKAEVKKLYSKLNPFASPLQSTAWIVLTGLWWLLSLVLVTLDHAKLFD